MAKDFEYYFAQLQKIENNREKQAEKEIRKLYKELLADTKHFLADEYFTLAQDGKLTYDILRAKGRDARFLEEVEQRLSGLSPKVAQEIRKTVDEMYALSFDGMVDAVKKAKTTAELKEAFQGLQGVSAETLREVVNNPLMDIALERNHKNILWDIKREIHTGLINGDRYETMAKRLATSLDGDYKKAVTIVRTETERAREAGHFASAKEINDTLKQGVTNMRMVKTWKTMKDGKVRDTHGSMEGVTVAMDDVFVLPSGVTTLAPKQSGVASEDINCRCFVKYHLEEEIQQPGRKFTDDDILMDYSKGFETMKITKDDIRAMSLNDARNFALSNGIDFDVVANSSLSELQETICAKYDEHAKAVISQFDAVRDEVITKANGKKSELIFGMTNDDLENLSKTELTNNMFQWGFDFDEVGTVHGSDDYKETFLQLVQSKKQSVPVSMTQDEYYDMVGKIAKKQKGVDTALEYQYVATSNSFKINEALYGGKPLNGQDKIVVEYLKEKAEPLRKDMALYRAVDDKFLIDNNVKVGGVIENLGFSSTAIAPHEACASKGVIFKMNAPKGTKAFASTNIDEGEFILMPGQKMRVRSIEEADSVMCTVWNTENACFNTKIVQKDRPMGKMSGENKVKIVEVDIINE